MSDRRGETSIGEWGYILTLIIGAAVVSSGVFAVVVGGAVMAGLCWWFDAVIRNSFQ